MFVSHIKFMTFFNTFNANKRTLACYHEWRACVRVLRVMSLQRQTRANLQF